MDKAGVCKVSVGDFAAEIRPPVLSICEVMEKGLIFTSSGSFEVGDSIELGFHLCWREEGMEERGRRDEFFTCEGQVASCLLCAGVDGLPVFEVTLLFTEAPSVESQRLAHCARRGHAPVDCLLRGAGTGLN